MPIAAIDDVVVSNGHGRIYPEGWQSWGPTTTYALGQTPHRPDHSGQQTMRFRPEAPMPSHGFQAEGLLVLDPGTGEPIRSYSGPDALRTVPSIRAYLNGPARCHGGRPRPDRARGRQHRRCTRRIQAPGPAALDLGASYLSGGWPTCSPHLT